MGELRIGTGPPLAELLGDRVDEYVSTADLVARVEYRFLSDRLTPDPHGVVVRLASLVLACHPKVDVVRAVAMDARNLAHGTRGLEMASKWLRRCVLPSATDIAWNRRRLRMIASIVAADTLTERVVPELQLTERVTRLIRRVATIWLTHSGNSAVNLRAIDAERRSLVAEIDGLPPLPATDSELTGPLDPGLDVDNDPLQSVLRSCLLGLIDSLASAAPNHFRTSALLTQLMSRLSEIALENRWWIIGHDCLPGELSGLQSLLDQLRDISTEFAGDPAWGTRSNAIANQAQQAAVTRVAKAARRRSISKLTANLQAICSAVDRPGVRVEVATRSDPENGLISPQSEVLLIVMMESLEQWGGVVEQLVNARQKLSEHRRVWAVPVRKDALVASLAVKLQTLEALSIDPGWDNWDKDTDRQLTAPLSDGFFELWSLAVKLSVISALLERPCSDADSTITARLVSECKEAYERVIGAVEVCPESALLHEVARLATAIVEKLSSELDNDATNPGALAVEALNIVDGEPSELLDALVGTNLLLIEHAVDPGDAERLYGRLTASDHSRDM